MKVSRRNVRRDDVRAGASNPVGRHSTNKPASARTSLKWRFEFSEDGGYDCMSHAFYIYEGDTHIATLDLVDFGQRRSWEEDTTGARLRGEKYAALIVNAVNEYLKKQRAKS